MFKKIAFISLAFLISAQVHSATLNVDSSGNLLGASDVDVGGDLYSVSFLDGPCITVFSPCNEATGFAFNDVVTADLASQALLDQVLIDAGLGNFDTIPDLTFGCAADEQCNILTPYEFLSGGTVFRMSIAVNRNLIDEVLPGTKSRTSSTGLDPFAVYAVWSPAPVPIPAAVWLFGTALIGLVGFGKRRKPI